MNLAASTLVIFLLVSPALIARRLYYTKELSRDFTKRNTLTEIFSSMFLAVLLHALWICVSNLKGYPSVNFDFVTRLLFSADKIQDFSSFTNYTSEIFKYFWSLSLVAALGGYFLKILVRTSYLDRFTKFLRYDNKWFYLISGEALDIKELNFHRKERIFSKDIASIEANVYLNLNDNTFFSGTIVDYQLAENNSVDYVVLTNTTKNTSYGFVDGDHKVVYEGDGSEKKIMTKTISADVLNSEYFVIPYSEIKSISFKYLMKSDKGFHVFLSPYIFIKDNLSKFSNFIRNKFKKKISN